MSLGFANQYFVIRREIREENIFKHFFFKLKRIFSTACFREIGKY